MENGRTLSVLLVEDDAALRSSLELHLAAQPSWSVRSVGDGKDALNACGEQLPDLVVLDVMLPGCSGLEVCATLRARYHPSPGVLVVTARAEEADVILGFDVGADDYVIKPCRPREVIARLRALTRRLAPAHQRASEGTKPLTRGPLSIDLAARELRMGTKPIKLTPTEFEMLVVLACDPGVVHTRAELLTRVFDTNHEGYARNVDCHVARLRRKLEDAGVSPAPITTVHGAGYRFSIEGAS
jgi:DNA-binding response OmpR family regulator